MRDIEPLRVALELSREKAEKLPKKLLDVTSDFLAGPTIGADDWKIVRALTHALISDLLALGAHRRDELFSTIAQIVAKDGQDYRAKAELALHVLTDELQLGQFTFDQDFSVPQGICDAVKELASDTAFVSVQTKNGDEEVYVTCNGESGKVAISVTLRAGTTAQAKSRGVDYAREALSKLSFAASLSIVMPPHGRDEWQIEGDEPRLSRDGVPVVPDEPTGTMPVICARPTAVGFCPATPLSVSETMRHFPTLARTEERGRIDARARLARTLHWMAIADQLDGRSPERLAHAWTAVEHLVAAGTDAKGPEVVRYLASVGAVEHMLAIGGDVYRECLAALHLNACLRPTDPAVIDRLCEVLGETERTRYAGSTSGVLSPRSNLKPAAPVSTVSDKAGLAQLLRWGPKLASIADAVAPAAPFAAQRLLDVAQEANSDAAVLRWLRALYFEAAALLQHVYDLRNQLVHDADPFVFESAHRMEDLYQRFRMLVDPLIGRLVRRAAEGATDLPHLLAVEASVYARIETDLKSCGAKRIPFDLERLLSYMPER